MLKRKTLVAAISLSLVLISNNNNYVCADTGKTPSDDICPADVKSAAIKLNDFSLKVLKELVQEKNKNDNVVLAPIGLTACTSVLTDGAKGATQDQLLQALSPDKSFSAAECSKVYKFITRRVPEVDLSFASSIYFSNDVKFDASFKERFQKQFDGSMQTASTPNVLSAQIIEWVKEKSKNMIILKSEDISPSSVGVINVLYFKALWSAQFEPVKTKTENFTKSDNTPMTVDMMHQGFFSQRALYGESVEDQILGLSYLAGEKARRAPFSMYIILPKNGNTPEKILAKLTASKINERIDAMQYKCGSLALPRFAITADSSFIPPLQKLKVQEAFTPKADFSAMANIKPAYITDFSQKLKLKVNERGTEAAAFTQVVMTLGGLEEQHPFNLVVDKPFIMIIRDNDSKAILLAGIIRNPERDIESAQKIEQEFKNRIEESELAYRNKADETSIRGLQYNYTLARDYFVSQAEYKKAREYSNKIIALTKVSDTSSSSTFRLDMDLSKHLEIELKLGKKDSAIETIKQLVNLYFDEHSTSTCKNRQIDEWWNWEKIFEQCDKHLIELHEDRTRLLAAKESVFKESIRDRARQKEWHFGAWRRKPTTIGIPEGSANIDFRQFMNNYKNSLKLLTKDTAAMQLLKRKKQVFLNWHPTYQSSGHDDLGLQQFKLANLYLETKQPAKAIPFLELSILNQFEDSDSESVSTHAALLVSTLKTLGRTSEANELAGTLNSCKNTCNSYTNLLTKWKRLCEMDNILFREELRRQEQEDWEREMKHAK
ncbi:MAG: serpin family protein [Candidatus Melainabacteria bacterium]|nr:serpin family protein [Candidatus Melainabacteria bacterium]